MANLFRVPGQIRDPASHSDRERFRGNRDPEKGNTAAKRRHLYRQKTGHAPTNAVDDRDLQCLLPMGAPRRRAREVPVGWAQDLQR